MLPQFLKLIDEQSHGDNRTLRYMSSETGIKKYPRNIWTPTFIFQLSGYISYGSNLHFHTLWLNKSSVSVIYKERVDDQSDLKGAEIQSFVTTWMSLVDIMLSEINQTEKDRSCTVSHTESKKVELTERERRIISDRSGRGDGWAQGRHRFKGTKSQKWAFEGC